MLSVTDSIAIVMLDMNYRWHYYLTWQWCLLLLYWYDYVKMYLVLTVKHVLLLLSESLCVCICICDAVASEFAAHPLATFFFQEDSKLFSGFCRHHAPLISWSLKAPRSLHRILHSRVFILRVYIRLLYCIIREV